MELTHTKIGEIALLLLLALSVTMAFQGSVANASIPENTFHAVNVGYGSGQGFGYDDLVKIRQMGFNTVRLYLYWGQLMPTDEATINAKVFTVSVGPTGTTGLDYYVNWCGQLGLKVIILMVWTATWAPPSWASQNFETLFRSPDMITGFKNAWFAVAQRYKDKPYVMFELLNEPWIADKRTDAPANYKMFCESVIDSIRSSGAGQLILVPLLCAGRSCEEVTDEQPDIQRENVAWATHCYEPWGNYDPNTPEYCFDYQTGRWGWFGNDKYVYWRIKRCADWILAHGKAWVNTEFGKAEIYYGWDYYLDLVLRVEEQLGVSGWCYHCYSRTDPSGFSVVNPQGTVKDEILNILKKYMPIPIGSETSGLSAWTGSYAGPTSGCVIELTTVVTSTGTNSSEHAKTMANGDGAYIFESIPEAGTLYSRMYVRYPARITGDGPVLFWLFNGNNPIAYVKFNYVGYAGQLAVANYVERQVFYRNLAVSENKWYCIEFAVNISPTAGQLKVWVDGSLVFEQVNRNTGSLKINLVRAGIAAAWGATEIYFDDVALAGAYIGP